MLNAFLVVDVALLQTEQTVQFRHQVEWAREHAEQNEAEEEEGVEVQEAQGQHLFPLLHHHRLEGHQNSLLIPAVNRQCPCKHPP